MRNLLQEVERELKSEGLTLHDIIWIGTDDGKYRMTWWQFKESANMWYAAHEDGYRPWVGGLLGIVYSPIVRGLVIVGDGWWLSRTHDAEYNQEFWTFNRMPVLQAHYEKLESLWMNEAREHIDYLTPDEYTKTHNAED